MKRYFTIGHSLLAFSMLRRMLGPQLQLINLRTLNLVIQAQNLLSH